MEGGENRISFFKDVKIIDGKADTIYLTLSKEIEKCYGVESLSAFGSDGGSVIIRHKKGASKLKKDIPKISIHCHNNRLAILPFFIKNTFLVKNNYLIC